MARKTKTDRRLVEASGAAAGAYLGRRAADERNRVAGAVVGGLVGWAAGGLLEAWLDRQAGRWTR